jgi:hypothetical protein
MRQHFAAFLCFAFLPAAAHASGGLSCEADDGNLKLEVQSGVTRGMGGPFFEFKAKSEIKAGATPPDLRSLTLDSHLVHHWLSGKELNLAFYYEREGDKPHAYVEIVVETDAQDELDFKGTYELTVFNTEVPEGTDSVVVKATGDVACMAE